MEPLPASSIPNRYRNEKFFHLTFKELITLLFTSVLPLVIAIHTIVIARSERKRITESRQQQIFDQLLDYIYQLHVDEELNQSAEPWAFANARYRSAHRQWDGDRKQQSIQFLKEKGLIGREYMYTDQGAMKIGCSRDIIQLKHLNFDGVKFESSAKHVYKLNLTCIHFDQVSLVNAFFSASNLDYALFDQSFLSGSVFSKTSLNNSVFYQCKLDYVDFTTAEITGALFIGVNLSNVKLTPEQLNQILLYNVTTPDGSFVQQSIEPEIYHQGFPSFARTTSSPALNLNTTSDDHLSETSLTTVLTTTVIERLNNISANATWSENGIVVIIGLSNYIASIAIDTENGTIFVADSNNNRIIAWAPGDQEIREVLKNLNRPTHVLIEKESESLLIADHGSRRVIRWSLRNNKTETIIDSIGCWGLAVDDEGTLFVTDTSEHAVKRYPKRGIYGEIIAGGNGEGSGSHQLHWPEYITIDHKGSIYVSDYWNHRVIKWNRGDKNGTIVAGFEGQGSKNTQLHHPRTILIDVNENLYIADSLNHRVIRYQKNSTTADILVDSSQTHDPCALAFDPENNLYIADNSKSVVRFSIITDEKQG